MEFQFFSSINVLQLHEGISYIILLGGRGYPILHPLCIFSPYRCTIFLFFFFSWYVLSDGSSAKNEVTVEDWLPKPYVGKQSFPELIFLGMIEEKKKKDAVQLGRVNNTGSRLLGSAASMTSNKPALPDRTPDGNAGCGVARRLRGWHGENGKLKNCWAVT